MWSRKLPLLTINIKRLSVGNVTLDNVSVTGTNMEVTSAVRELMELAELYGKTL
jgi:hypothetical protein